MKATDLLKQQHQEVSAILHQVEKGNGRTREILEQLADDLAAHMVIEQGLFYPAVMSVQPPLVLEAFEEHAVARFALKRLMRTEPSDQTFKAKVTTLKELIAHHVREEEDVLFPKAEEGLGDSSEDLALQMKELFEKTRRTGYARVVGPGGQAVVSGAAPDLHQ